MLNFSSSRSLMLLRPCRKLMECFFHQYSWNVEVETTWISFIGWPLKTTRQYYVPTLTIINDFPFKVHLISLEPLKIPQSKWEKMSCSHVKLMEIRHQKQDGVELARVFLQMVSWKKCRYTIHTYLHTHIMFYKQRSCWTTVEHFSNFWWSLLPVAIFWQKKSMFVA